MQAPYKKYKVRAGTIDSGKEYEFKMVALLSLRCILEDVEDVWLVSNADGVGAFDDIIFRIQRTDKTATTYMLQLKHKENSNNVVESEFLSAKGDFSLSKYSRDLAKLRESCQVKNTGILSDLGDFDEITFALFTNRGVNEYAFLEKNCFHSGTSMLNTNKNNLNLFKFIYKKCEINVNTENCRNLYFISNQAHVTHLNEEIFTEIKKLVGKFELTHINVKLIAEKYTKYVCDWAKGKLGGHYYLTKDDIIYKLSELLLQQYEVDINRVPYVFYEEDQKHIWNNIISDKLITVVEGNDETMNFLTLYLGSEVKKYLQDTAQVKLWLDNVSDQAHNGFYQENVDLKVQMLKVVGNHGKITFTDVYKCLWFSNKLPLLVKASDEQAYHSIIKIIKFTNYNLRIIMIVNITSLPHPIWQHHPGYFATLNDLNKEERDLILNQHVKLQGRASILLGELIHDESFGEIKSSDIIEILSGNFNIGNKYKPLSECFIERTLSGIFIKLEALRDIRHEAFLIHNPHEITFVAEDFNSANIIRLEEKAKIQKLKSEGKTIHRLVLRCTCLEWKETFGNIRSIQKYQLKEIEEDEEGTSVESLIESENKLNTSFIISANPGMGKSTLLDYVAAQTSPDRWVLRVDLNDHHDYYEAIKQKNLRYKALDHLSYFNQKFNSTKLAKMVFQRLLSTKRILVLLDGFDEISISCKEEVTQIVKSLQEEGYALWITTRPIMKSYLEQQLNTLSITIEPFSLQDQIYFLTRYFTKIAGNSEQKEAIVEFVIKLLKAAQVNLNDHCLEFTGIPLQTMLLADVFSSELVVFLSTGIVDLNRKFDLLYLYKEFIRRKNQILCDRFGVGLKNMREFFENHQQLLAIMYLFEEHLHQLDVCKPVIKYYQENPDKIAFLQLEGVLVAEQTNDYFKVSFIHRTFAEYLAALWLSDNINSEDVTIKKTVGNLLDIRYRHSNLISPFLFRIFDCVLAQGCDTHLAVIHHKIEELEKMVRLNPNLVDAVDAGGRTVLHVMAISGEKSNDMLYFNILNEEEEQNEMLDIIEKIPNVKITNTKDRLGFGALDYAVSLCNLRFADKMCQKCPFLKLGISIPMRNRYFDLCARYNLKFLFKVLFLHCACENILYRSYTKDETIESFFTLSTMPTSTSTQEILAEFTKNFGATTLWDLFQFETMNDLRFAVIYGTKHHLKLLLSKGADVNGSDIFHNAPLHYAALNDRLDMVKMLISAGANLEKPGKNGYTALHYSVDHYNEEITEELLLRGADINKTNDKGDTPLHVALNSYANDCAKLLLRKGAKPNVVNKKGKIPLHYAAKHGYDEIAEMLISTTNECMENDASVNYQMKNGKTPIHSLLSHVQAYVDEGIFEYEKILYLLLRAGADINIQDKNGDTPLHYVSRKNYWDEYETDAKVSRKFSKYVAELFIKRGADTTLKNKEGKTALDLATEANKTEFMFLLQEKDSECEEIFIHMEDNPQITTKSARTHCTLS